MTNIAIALAANHDLAGMIKRIVIMGGAAQGGNVTPCAEFNIYVDPEAAKIVYESGVPLVALGLDVATHFDVNFSPEDIAAFAESPRPEARFCPRPSGLPPGGALRRTPPSSTAWLWPTPSIPPW